MRLAFDWQFHKLTASCVCLPCYGKTAFREIDSILVLAFDECLKRLPIILIAAGDALGGAVDAVGPVFDGLGLARTKTVVASSIISPFLRL